jgi:hypothetical protein
LPTPPIGEPNQDNNRFYKCIYEDVENDGDLIVVATAICLTLSS